MGLPFTNEATFKEYAKRVSTKVITENKMYHQDFAVISSTYFMEALVKLKNRVDYENASPFLVVHVTPEALHIDHSPIFSVVKMFGSIEEMLELWLTAEANRVDDRMLILVDEITIEMLESFIARGVVQVKADDPDRNYKKVSLMSKSIVHIFSIHPESDLSNTINDKIEEPSQ